MNAHLGAMLDRQPVVSTLIVTFRQHRLLERCLASLELGARGIPTETVIVVNGVPLQDEHRRAAEHATLVQAPVNLGLAGGLQYARSLARGRYLAVVQDDVEVDPDWLAPLVDVLESDPSVGLAGSRIETMKGELFREGLLVWRDLGLSNVPEAADRDKPRAVDFCPSAACLTRAEAWDSVGGPDHRLFPLWNVDVDFGLRLAEADWTVMVVPRSIARHRGHGSTTSRLRAYLKVRNGKMLRRHHRLLLEQRPPWSDDPLEVQAALTRCAEAAERRRSGAHRRRTPVSPVPLETLVRCARRDSLRVRIGTFFFPMRVAIHGWRRRNSTKAP